jgi:hypothetical protein
MIPMETADEEDDDDDDGPSVSFTDKMKKTLGGIGGKKPAPPVPQVGYNFTSPFFLCSPKKMRLIVSTDWCIEFVFEDLTTSFQFFTDCCGTSKASAEASSAHQCSHTCTDIRSKER